VLGVWLAGSHNPYTPAGYVGYLTKGALFGPSRFHAVQRGPTSPWRQWLLDVTNVSVTPYTYTETFAADDSVLSRDSARVHTAIMGHVHRWTAMPQGLDEAGPDDVHGTEGPHE